MKIPVLRVEVNGQLVAIAGAENLDILSGQVGFGASPTGGIEVSRVIFGVMGKTFPGLAFAGLSLLARGNRNRVHGRLRGLGPIPAAAGEPNQRLHLGILDRVFPRSRGSQH
jgi:hypothetical protein